MQRNIYKHFIHQGVAVTGKIVEQVVPQPSSNAMATWSPLMTTGCGRKGCDRLY